ncbi:Tar ligand binding domain-containing protein [Escherichia coli]|uniref:Tar ligand binding domain-containing protein n=1 Tax=Escherichia coli TaxID=562 RepID=UPI0010AC54C9|nr:Tar ligand binding domain-containing protein [Escherichia coli]EJZ1783912.1 Tar ligand binding domain-containing protein [Shigella dysenteriae]EFC6515495.1 methyl-accepting chemotaxis protein [Escherichia coli]EIB9516775.1 Tar ligand binding domain-containing protein [Escherichia coli]EJN1897543.1 Tar ligand binding domain-containing protein [Escherichia coli]EJQ4524865.1 Tar ligand binding domain-containing protein [Escherichia coli]
MINRIRVVTLLVMVLGVFALLQLISGSLFFSSLHHSQKSFVVSNQLREQQGELTSTWDLMLQTRINLSRSAVRMMMDSSNQQSNAKVELLDSARKTLAQAATHYKKFKSMAPLPEMVATSRNIDEKYKNYHTALTELIDYLDYGNTGAYFAQPTQGMQNAMGEAFAQYALSSEKLYRDIVTDNADDYRFAQWQLAVIALVQESAAAAAALEEQASRLTQAVSAFRLAASPLTNKPQTPSRPASEQPPAQPRLRIAEQYPNWETF